MPLAKLEAPVGRARRRRTRSISVLSLSPEGRTRLGVQSNGRWLDRSAMLLDLRPDRSLRRVRALHDGRVALPARGWIRQTPRARLRVRGELRRPPRVALSWRRRA